MSATGKKILIVDDDKTIHTMLKLAFQKAGYQVFAAMDAMQGVMMAKQVKPDLIVLDIMMPAGGGFAVYERLQLMSGSFEIPFLIYSSADKGQIASKIQESPSVIILDKTATVAQILEAVAKLLPA